MVEFGAVILMNSYYSVVCSSLWQLQIHKANEDVAVSECVWVQNDVFLFHFRFAFFFFFPFSFLEKREAKENKNAADFISNSHKRKDCAHQHQRARVKYITEALYIRTWWSSKRTAPEKKASKKMRSKGKKRRRKLTLWDVRVGRDRFSYRTNARFVVGTAVVRAAPNAMCTHIHTVSYQKRSQFFCVAFFPYLFVDSFFRCRSLVKCALVQGYVCVCRCIGMHKKSVGCAPAPQCAPIRPIECVPLFNGKLCEIVPPMLRRHAHQCSVGTAVSNTINVTAFALRFFFFPFSFSSSVLAFHCASPVV